MRYYHIAEPRVAWRVRTLIMTFFVKSLLVANPAVFWGSLPCLCCQNGGDKVSLSEPCNLFLLEQVRISIISMLESKEGLPSIIPLIHYEACQKYKLNKVHCHLLYHLLDFREFHMAASVDQCNPHCPCICCSKKYRLVWFGLV